MVSEDVPIVKDAVMRMRPQEVCVQFNCEVKNILGASDTSVENPPSYTMSGQHCICTKGHIHSSYSKPYQCSNHFLGQCLGLQLMIDLCYNWLCVERTGSSSHCLGSVGYSGDVKQVDGESNGTFDKWDMDLLVDCGFGLSGD